MQDYISVNEKAYNLSADEYAQRVEEYSDRDTELMRPFIESMSGEPSRSVLEPGPGSGLSLSLLAKAGFKTTAIELAEGIIKVARKTSPETTFIHDDFLRYDFGGQRFQGVFAKAFIHLFPKRDAIKVLDKIHHLTEKRGSVFIATTVHEVSSEGFEVKADYDTSPVRFRKKWTVAELREALEPNWTILDENFNTERGKHWLAITARKREL